MALKLTQKPVKMGMDDPRLVEIKRMADAMVQTIPEGTRFDYALAAISMLVTTAIESHCAPENRIVRMQQFISMVKWNLDPNFKEDEDAGE